MKIITLSHKSIDNPIYTKLAATAQIENYDSDEPVKPCDMFVLDAASCTPAEVTQAIGSLEAGISVLLLDPTDEHKQALGKRIGFRSHGAGRGYLVAQTIDENGHERYRIIEARDTKIKVSTTSLGVQGDKNGATKTFPSQLAVEEHQENSLSDAEVDLFLSAAATAPEAVSSPPAGLVWTQWIYSATYTFTASGTVNSDTGLGPPPSKTITLLLTYSFDAALNNAPQSGPFQFLGLLMTGIFQNNGMSKTTDTSYGWIIASLYPEFQAPSNLYWYSSSPANTNNQSQVTTGSSVNIGFDSNGVSGGYTYSSSVTNNITDWYIKQLTATEWLYAQNTPFDGSTEDASVADACVNWYSGHININSFPAISTSSLQSAVNAVWKTNSVLTTEVPISIDNFMQVDYMMVKEFLGLGTQFALWWSTSVPTDTFSIDLSVVSS